MSAIDDIPNNIILFPPFNFRNIPVKVVSEMIRLLMDLRVEMREARRRALTLCTKKLYSLFNTSRNERSPKKGIDIFFLFLYWWVERRSSMKNTDTLRSRLWLGVWESRKEKRKNNWINISSNDAVKKFFQMSDNLTTKREIEKLLADEFISCVCQACA